MYQLTILFPSTQVLFDGTFFSLSILNGMLHGQPELKSSCNSQKNFLKNFPNYEITFFNVFITSGYKVSLGQGNLERAF